MSLYMKRFVYASLFYLGLAAIIGILDGTVNLGYVGTFAHSHFNLLGFMAMIVFGIGYFILPRFNGSELRFESWVPVHFWLANISLIGMVVFRGLAVDTGENLYQILFIVSASLQVISIFMFVVNIWITLTPKKVPQASAPATTLSSGSNTGSSFVVAEDKPVVRVNANSPVAQLVDTLPSLKEILVQGGLTPLALPGHMDKVRAAGVTLGNAARNHQLDLDQLIESVENELRRNGFSTGDGEAVFSANTMIGDVIKNNPRSRATFQKYFGSGCFDCPGQAYETIDMACRMHGIEPEVFLKELNEAAG
jgi:hybrid cluster-associated redox disulfide protein